MQKGDGKDASWFASYRTNTHFITSEVIAARAIRSMLELFRNYCGEHITNKDKINVYSANSINRIGQRKAG